MNQIIQIDDNNESKTRKKKISVPVIVIFFPLVIIGIYIAFSFKTYANDVTEVAKEQESISDNIPVVELTENQEENNDEGTEEIENEPEQQQISEQEEKSTKEISYTASNGETYNIIGKLNIPSLNIEYPILSTSSTALLKISLNRYWGSYPNEVGNMVVIGHNYKNNKFFSNLPKINIGDVVKISDVNRDTLDYFVYETDIIDPYDNSCTSQLTNGRKEITLITCYYENGNPHATKRFIAKAVANE